MRRRWLSCCVLFSVSTLAAECRAVRFETKLVQEACAEGGQKAAREAMKRFQRAARAGHPELECKTCHSSLTPDYRLRADGLAQLKKLGGR